MQVERLQVGRGALPLEVRRQPIVECGEKVSVAHAGPARIVRMHEGQPRSELNRAIAPGEELQR